MGGPESPGNRYRYQVNELDQYQRDAQALDCVDHLDLRRDGASRSADRARFAANTSSCAHPPRPGVLVQGVQGQCICYRFRLLIRSYLINARSKIRAQASCTMPR
jgi:hypothetical protein